ncbi:hypothetical protein ABIE27_004377 [Paenibacillus sp. 4624]
MLAVYVMMINKKLIELHQVPESSRGQVAVLLEAANIDN